MFTPMPSVGSVRGHAAPQAIILTDPKALGALLRLVLEASGLTQAEVARRLGIRDQSICQYLKGRRVKPTLGWIARFMEVCGARFLVELPGAPLDPRVPYGMRAAAKRDLLGEIQAKREELWQPKGEPSQAMEDEVL